MYNVHNIVHILGPLFTYWAPHILYNIRTIYIYQYNVYQMNDLCAVDFDFTISCAVSRLSQSLIRKLGSGLPEGVQGMYPIKSRVNLITVDSCSSVYCKLYCERTELRSARNFENVFEVRVRIRVRDRVRV